MGPANKDRHFTSHPSPPPRTPRSAVLGELDEARDKAVNWASTVAAPVGAITLGAV
jgi:hypothetical protein